MIPRIRKLMAMAGLDVSRLSELMGVSRSNLSFKLNNHEGKKFNEKDIEKLAEVFCVKVSYILKGE